jgi:hypothetical protein
MTNESQRKEVKMILKHMSIGNYKHSSPSTLSNMLSMGEDLKDERKKATWSSRITFTTRCSSFFFHDKHNA